MVPKQPSICSRLMAVATVHFLRSLSPVQPAVLERLKKALPKLAYLSNSSFKKPTSCKMRYHPPPHPPSLIIATRSLCLFPLLLDCSTRPLLKRLTNSIKLLTMKSKLVNGIFRKFPLLYTKVSRKIR